MKTYKVDHNGSCHSRETGRIYTYKMGVPVELPDDVAEALGHSAELVKETEPVKKGEVKKKEEKKEEEKEVKEPPKDKMVKGGKTVTK